MAFSVVIPAYQAEATIGRAVKSLFGQTLPPREILIIADDHANYIDILSNQGIQSDVLRCVPSQRIASGAGSSRNVGIEHAASNYIAFLDADDEYLPTRLQKLLPLVERYGAACTNMLMRSDNGTNLPTIHAVFPNRDTLNPAMLSAASMHTIGNIAFDRARCNGARFVMPHHLDDITFALSLFDYVEWVGYVPDALAIYYRHDGSTCHKPDAAKKFYDTIVNALSESSDVYAAISAYKAFPFLERHLLAMQYAEKEVMDMNDSTLFHGAFLEHAKSLIFPHVSDEKTKSVA